MQKRFSKQKNVYAPIGLVAVLLILVVTYQISEKHSPSSESQSASQSQQLSAARPTPIISEIPVQIESEKRRVTVAPISCKWSFVEYVPSPFEVAYYKHSDAELKYPCKLLNESFPKENSEFFSTTPSIHNPPMGEVKCDLQPLQPPDAIYSYSNYKNNCTGVVKKTYLEPLAGVLRHPGTCFVESQYFLRKDYLLIDGWHSSSEVLDPKAKRLFFDLGASTWNSGLGGASQGWFYDLFKSICAEFDALFAWEYREHKPSDIYKQIPAAIHRKYHWYNIPVNTDFSSPSHPFNMIRAMATPSDFVVLKIDIDTPSVELPLIEYMLTHPDLMELVDEFFFEHHVIMDPLMRLGWGGPPLVNGTPRDSIDIFSKMRKHGVRAHSWL